MLELRSHPEMVTFEISEQDGKPEHDLKTQLARVFEESEFSVQRAYLVLAELDGSSGVTVALCLLAASFQRGCRSQGSGYIR
jgi:hypothetical protein